MIRGRGRFQLDYEAFRRRMRGKKGKEGGAKNRRRGEVKKGRVEKGEVGVNNFPWSCCRMRPSHKQALLSTSLPYFILLLEVY